MTYTDRELMVIAAAREIGDGELIFVGMRLPLLAFALAKRTHAPRALGLFENGIVRESPAPETPFTMSDPPNIAGALWSTTTGNIMALLQQGLVDMGFIGGAEVDRYGNLNTSYIGDWRRPKVKLPGSGGGGDIASLAKRFVIIMPQEKHRFRERVDYITSPGHGDGRGPLGPDHDARRVPLPSGNEGGVSCLLPSGADRRLRPGPDRLGPQGRGRCRTDARTHGGRARHRPHLGPGGLLDTLSSSKRGA